jgi:hypothetical protein
MFADLCRVAILRLIFKPSKINGLYGGRYRDRTYDPTRVKGVLYGHFFGLPC